MLTISEWADRSRRLSSEASAEAGQWHTDRAEYQRGIMDAISDPAIEEIVVMAGSQCGKSEMLLNTIGYYIEHQPAPILIVQPTLESAKTFSLDRIQPMVRDCPSLTHLVAESKAKSGDSTILHKSFVGGHLTLVGSNAPASLAGRPIRVLLLDEVDRFTFSAGKEGNPIRLAMKRTTTFFNRKIVMTSTPTVKGISVIEAAFERGCQNHYHVPCPKCGAMQQLRWANVKWETDKDTQKPLLDTVHYECEACHAALVEGDKAKMIRNGQWIAEHPERIRVASFHINELYSPWSTWQGMVEAFYDAKQNVEDLRVWINTSLGESFDDTENMQISEHKLIARVEPYESVPEGVVMLTAGVDVQDSYLVVETVGWGMDEESYVVDYKQIVGSPSDANTWKELELYLTKQFQCERGGYLGIAAACIDSGFSTDNVYTFCKQHELKRWYCTKGMAGSHPIAAKTFVIRGRQRVKLYFVGTDTAKGTLFDRLQKEEFGAGYIHFGKNCDLEFFKQLTAEKQVKKYVKGYPKLSWVKIRARNEALDCYNYALAAYRILNPDMEQVRKNFEMTHKYEEPQQAAPSEQQEAAAPKQTVIPRPNVMQQLRKRQNFVTGRTF